MTQKIRVVGSSSPLFGSIKIEGAKNAALPLMCASLLTEEELCFENLPKVSDIILMGRLLSTLGAEVDIDFGKITCKDILNVEASYDLVSKMRASILVLGPLLARCGRAKVALPGGCAIGARPVNLHISGLQQLGATIEIQDGYIVASAKDGLKGALITLPIVTVTGTENLMLAACLAEGETRIIHAAREPEIIDLANCLRSMGASIQGDGTDEIIIQGVDKLFGAQHSIIVDRIEAGTYAIAAAITGGEIHLIGAKKDYLQSFIASLLSSGVSVIETESGILVTAGSVQGVDIMTEPFPGFPTDLQAQFMALMTMCNGASMITETIWENRFMHVFEMCRMGANITVHKSSALVRGVSKLSGAPVIATDLRASVSLVLAGLVANGETLIDKIHHLDRGYVNFEEKLRSCGADIERIVL